MTTVEKRRQYIADFVKNNGSASVNDLANLLGVTEVTIRTDLRVLASDGVIKRSHGGAITVSRSVVDMKEDIKATINIEQKKKIAVIAAQMVEKDDSIIIASGSTMVTFAQTIIPKEHLYVVTPSVRIAMKLIDNPAVSIYQLGGLIYPNTLSVRGSHACDELKSILCSKLFFGVEGFDIESGLTCATVEEAHLTQALIKSASQVILLADSSKFGRRGFGRICALEDVDILVTDAGLDDEVRHKIEALGVTVKIA